MPENKVFLIVLDGYGLREETTANAVKLAVTPFLHSLDSVGSVTRLRCSGLDVGLPKGLMGNSEVGHLNLGAGRIVYQEITRIDREIEVGRFFDNPVIVASARHALEHNSKWHLFGLVSDGGVHSSLDHLYALLEVARRIGLKEVYLHAFMDGRDTPPHSGVRFIEQVEAKMREIGVGKIASLCGRYWIMDRDKRWERVQRGYDMLVKGEWLRFDSAAAAVNDSYKREITDEFIEPSLVTENGVPRALVSSSDSVFFFNFRADRAREITWALTEESFDHFPRESVRPFYSTMTMYHQDLTLPIAYPQVHLSNILGEVVSRAGLKQFRTAETEKYAHVTYFFNGGAETPFPAEERRLVPSPNVATYDLQPEMSAPEVTRGALEALDKNYSFILLNFANPDMVGHTGVLPAVIKALEALDPLVKSIVDKAVSKGYHVIITADHGNSEQMQEEDGSPHTAHTTNPVPCVLITPDGTFPPLQEGRLADIAPTVLHILGLPQPLEMEGTSLLMRGNG